MLTLRAVQTLKGNEAATAEILRALRKTKGNMREACALLEIGKSSMYRLIKDLDCAAAVDKLILDLGEKVHGKVLAEKKPPAAKVVPKPAAPKLRVRRAAA